MALITLAGLALRLVFLSQPGHVVDLETFGNWALAAADSPWDQAYEATNANYPPGALLFFELIGRVYRAYVHTDPNRAVLRIALKLSAVVFDLAGGAVSYLIAARFTGTPRALLAAAIFDLNPALIYDSSLWGQNDSITTVTALGAVYCLLRRWRVAAWIVLAFAILNKPPVIVLAPLFVLEAWAAAEPAARSRRLLETGAGIAAALVTGYLVALPFYVAKSPLDVYVRMIAWYRVGSSLYPFNSANAFNLYALGGDFFGPDNLPVLGVPLKYWADLVFIVLLAVILWRYLRTAGERALLEASFLTMLAFFLVLTEMHERYLLYALTFVLPLAVLDRRYAWAATALTITAWLNLEYSLNYLWLEADKPPGFNYKESSPVLVHLCAAVNIGVFVVCLRAFFSNAGASRAPTGTLRRSH